jgi:DNA repair exonuclease SbcCD ATPase subunit
LIKYQTENEKLVLKIKELKASSIENDKRNFLKLETLQKENSFLKTQLDMHENEKKSRYAIDITKEKVRSEEMELKINELEYRVQIKEDELTALNKIHEAQCADYEKRIADIAEQSTKELKEKFKIDLDQHKTYILELESKMEWNLENQQVFSDAESRIKRYEDAIAEFHRLVESSSEVDDEARNPKDISKIKLLESQLENLEQEMKQKSTFPELKVFTEAQRPEISADKSVQILKRRIVTLENEKMDMLGKVQKSEHYAEQVG